MKENFWVRANTFDSVCVYVYIYIYIVNVLFKCVCWYIQPHIHIWNILFYFKQFYRTFAIAALLLEIYIYKFFLIEANYKTKIILQKIVWQSQFLLNYFESEVFMKIELSQEELPKCCPISEFCLALSCTKMWRFWFYSHWQWQTFTSKNLLSASHPWSQMSGSVICPVSPVSLLTDRKRDASAWLATISCICSVYTLCCIES